MSTPQRQALDARLRRAPKAPADAPIEAMRAGFAALMSTYPVPSEVRTTPTRLGGRPAVLVEPERPALPGMILYFHGGSFALGSPGTAMVHTANLVHRTQRRAISLDYRLAPEHPFPAAIDDGVAAYRELLDAGIPAQSVVFAGDSAGGGLTVTTTLAARDAGLPLPAAIVAFSPLFDHSHSGASITTKNGVDPFFTPDDFTRTAEWYLAGADPRQPLLSPALDADLGGLPPILLQAGTNELLLDDSVRLAARAQEAGVDVILDLTAGVPHVFQAFTDQLDEAGRALDRAALFLAQHLSEGARSDD